MRRSSQMSFFFGVALVLFATWGTYAQYPYLFPNAYCVTMLRPHACRDVGDSYCSVFDGEECEGGCQSCEDEKILHERVCMSRNEYYSCRAIAPRKFCGEDPKTRMWQGFCDLYGSDKKCLCEDEQPTDHYCDPEQTFHNPCDATIYHASSGD